MTQPETLFLRTHGFDTKQKSDNSNFHNLKHTLFL